MRRRKRRGKGGEVCQGRKRGKTSRENYGEALEAQATRGLGSSVERAEEPPPQGETELPEGLATARLRVGTPLAKKNRRGHEGGTGF